MFIRCIYIIAFNLFLSKVSAQSYQNDSMSIEIKSVNNFVVNNFNDLNIDIVYSPKLRDKKNVVYQHLVSSYKSTFGNCYFELHRFDSSSSSYQDITLMSRSNWRPLQDFKNEEEILKYDLEKAPLSFGEKKILTFNLLNFMHTLLKGRYCLKIFFRIGNNYGYDGKGNVITNSICYVESKVMCFEVIKDIETPNKIQ